MTTDQHRDAIVADLAEQHPLFAPVTLTRWVTEAFDRYAGARVQAYVPVLVRREVRARLRGLAGDEVVDLTGAARTGAAAAALG